ncbi:MAG: MFS transporter [Planctomycetota bacterium]|nr:MAG: MFS transporter [Planctomycetota bacterium]
MTTADAPLYTPRFFQVFAAVVLVMTGYALQFHFGQYIAYLGHGVDTLGKVLSLGMVGTLAIRLHIGRWIDRFGGRPVWLAGTVLFALSMTGMPLTRNFALIVALRMAAVMSVAAVLTTAAVFAAQMAPVARRAESIGTMGLAGFLGMMIGTTTGDFVFAGDTEAARVYYVYFAISAVCHLLSAGIIFFLPSDIVRREESPHPSTGSRPGGGQGAATSRGRKPAAQRGDRAFAGESGSQGNQADPPSGRDAPVAAASTWRTIRDHWPGTILLVGMVFSMVFCFQSSYLERLAEARGFKDIEMFFLIYAPTAMVLRVIFRRLPQRIGRSRTLVLGLLLETTGLMFLVGVTEEWHFVWPALLMGAGHCFIFPSMVDLCAACFPLSLRGTGTSLILGAGDLGMLVGFVTLGEIIDRHGFDTAIETLAAALLFATVTFAATRRDYVFKNRRLTPDPAPAKPTPVGRV